MYLPRTVGTTEEKNGLDANSLFTVDGDAFQKAFVLDDSGFSGDLLSADSLNLENAFRWVGILWICPDDKSGSDQS